VQPDRMLHPKPRIVKYFKWPTDIPFRLPVGCNP
jgi:hypothetical protein